QSFPSSAHVFGRASIRNWSRRAMPTVAMHVGRDEPFPDVGSASPEDADVVPGLVSAFPDHALEIPTRLVGETREFLWRDEEEIEPISDAVLVPDPEREESGWPTAAHVPLHIGQVVLSPRGNRRTLAGYTFARPRIRASATWVGDASTPTTSKPFLCRNSECRPGPQPRSRTRPRTRRIASRSIRGHLLGGVK